MAKQFVDGENRDGSLILRFGWLST